MIPLRIWTYALRIWLAATVALYVAFWLQLGGASSAAVTVAILAQPTRGAALAKAANRVAATVIGATMSLVIAGLFAGERLGTLISFICWMCICVFVGSFLRGYRAYAAVLSGYTVAIITIADIDSPQKVFTTTTDRVAAISIGILCVTLINDVFGSPAVSRGLLDRIETLHRDVVAYVRRMLVGTGSSIRREAELFARIAALRDDIDVVAHDMADGPQRGAGARTALIALIEMLRRSRFIAMFSRADRFDVAVRENCLLVLDGSVQANNLVDLSDSELSGSEPNLDGIARFQQGIALAEATEAFADGIRSLNDGTWPARDVRLPHKREFTFALRNAIRIGVALSLVSIFLVLAGWPSAVGALTITAVLCALSTTMPDPGKFAVGAFAGFLVASLCAGLVKYAFLTGAQDFPRLAIGIAPVLMFGCLLSVRPKIAGIGAISNVIFLVLLAPSNPQDYNPVSFFAECMFVSIALVAVLVASRLVLPVSAFDKQWKAIAALERSLAASAGQAAPPSSVMEFALSAHIGDYLASATDEGNSRPELLKGLLAASDLAAVATSIHGRLDGDEERISLPLKARQIRRVLAGGKSSRLYATGRLIAARLGDVGPELRRKLASLAADFWLAGRLFDAEGRKIRRFVDHDAVVKGEGRWS